MVDFLRKLNAHQLKNLLSAENITKKVIVEKKFSVHFSYFPFDSFLFFFSEIIVNEIFKIEK